jgi:hypothetical protein
MRAVTIRLGQVVTLSAILLGAVLDAVPALAHGGPVQLGAGPDGAGGLTVYASYVEDGHPARGLALTATATAGGVDRGPLALRPAGEGEGFYVLSAGALPAGHWTVTVTGDAAQQVRPVTTPVDVAAHGAARSPAAVARTSISHAGRSSRSALVAGGLVALALLAGVSLLIARRRGSR